MRILRIFHPKAILVILFSFESGVDYCSCVMIEKRIAISNCDSDGVFTSPKVINMEEEGYKVL